MKWPDYLGWGVVSIGIYAFLIWLAATFYDDGRCGEAGGVRVQTRSSYVCVKPLDLEKKP